MKPISTHHHYDSLSESQEIGRKYCRDTHSSHALQFVTANSRHTIDWWRLKSLCDGKEVDCLYCTFLSSHSCESCHSREGRSRRHFSFILVFNLSIRACELMIRV